MTFINRHKKISVALLDDHPLIHYSFEIMALQYPSLHVTGCFTRSHELLAHLRLTTPDVVVLDYRLDESEPDGLALMPQILTSHPDMPVLLVSSVASRAIVYAAFQAGIKGYIHKGEESPRYVDAIHTVAAGERYVSASLNLQLPVQVSENSPPGKINPLHQRLSHLLTPCEADVIRCFLNRMTTTEIADKFQRSPKTISGHKQAAKKKLGLGSDSELFKLYADRSSEPDDTA